MPSDFDGSLTLPRAGLFRPRAEIALSAWPFNMLRAFLFFLYANLAMWIPVVETIRPAQLVIAAGFALVLMEGVAARRGLKMVWPQSFLLLAFFGASVLSCLTALWAQLAVESAIDLGKCVLVFFLITETLDRTERMRSFLWMMVVGGFFPAVGTLIFYERGFTKEGRASWLGIFENANDDAFALVMLVPIAIGLFRLSGGRGKLVAGLAVLVYTLAIYTTFSRGSLIGLLATLVILGMRIRSNAVRAIGLVVIAAAVAVGSAFWSRGSGDFEGLSADATFNQRFITVRAGLDMLSDHPILGVGVGCSIVAFPNYVDFSALTLKSLEVHNTFVQALAETGVLGGVPYLLLMVLTLGGAHRLARRPRSDDPGEQERAILGSSLEGAFVGFLVCSLSGPYVLSWFPFILIGLVAAARRIASAAARPALPEAA
jgi:O-antigen ligase